MIDLETLTFLCPSCGFLIENESLNGGGIQCRHCESRIELTIFPAFQRRAMTQSREAAIGEAALGAEATCYFHAGRVAAFTCTRCGRFLCPLCRIDWAGEDVCAACLEAARTREGADTLASTRFHFDSLALTISTAGVLTGFFSVLTAPIALGFTLFTFRKECSIAPRTKIRFVLALMFSLATIVGWAVFFVWAFRRNTVFAPPGPAR